MFNENSQQTQGEKKPTMSAFPSAFSRSNPPSLSQKAPDQS